MHKNSIWIAPAGVILAALAIFVLVRSLLYAPANALTLQVGEIVMHVRPQASAEQAALQTKLSSVRWVAYAPTNFNPTVSPPIIPPDASIQADLQALKDAGFDGLVTY